jgi:hypothetical protein
VRTSSYFIAQFLQLSPMRTCWFATGKKNVRKQCRLNLKTIPKYREDILGEILKQTRKEVEATFKPTADGMLSVQWDDAEGVVYVMAFAARSKNSDRFYEGQK